jgi:hypothetical protein
VPVAEWLKAAVFKTVIGNPYRRFKSYPARTSDVIGLVAEWSKASVLKTDIGDPYHRFESYPTRIINEHEAKSEGHGVKATHGTHNPKMVVRFHLAAK